MADLTGAYADRVATWLLRPDLAAPTRPTGVYVALYVSGVEVSTAGTGYARAEFTTPTGPTGGSGSVTHTDVIAFGAPTDDWGAVDGAALHDAASGGTRITDIKALAAPLTVSNGDGAPSFGAGELTFTVG